MHGHNLCWPGMASSALPGNDLPSEALPKGTCRQARALLVSIRPQLEGRGKPMGLTATAWPGSARHDKGVPAGQGVAVRCRVVQAAARHGRRCAGSHGVAVSCPALPSRANLGTPGAAVHAIGLLRVTWLAMASRARPGRPWRCQPLLDVPVHSRARLARLGRACLGYAWHRSPRRWFAGRPRHVAALRG